MVDGRWRIVDASGESSGPLSTRPPACLGIKMTVDYQIDNSPHRRSLLQRARRVQG